MSPYNYHTGYSLIPMGRAANYKMSFFGAKEMILFLKCLPCKLKDLSLSPMTYTKKLEVVVQVRNPSSQGGGDSRIPGVYCPGN